MKLSVENLAEVFAVLKPDLSVQKVVNEPSVYAELDKNYSGFKGHVLIANHDFSQDWPTWECHPAGDEIVVLMSGQCEFLLKTETGVQTLVLDQIGSYVVVPKGIWHTAKIAKAAKVLFITPGENTPNVEHPALL
ncbi:hypothetical protein [Paraglaciecola sp.]|uniref:hypothetical protein n=1 Tax=Paraglaciecola sp. TaxID=1920173 RepID=UPI0030F40ED2